MIPSLLQIPSAVSDSKLHSVLPNNGKGDFTFDRSTGATRINKDGLIEEVGYFSSELVQNGDFSELGNELVTNGDFASNIDNWAAKDCTIVWDNGKLKCDNSSGNSNGGARQNVGLQNSTTYKLVATIQILSAGSNGTFNLFTSTAAGTGQSSVYTGSTLVAGGDAVTETAYFTTGTDGDVSIQFSVGVGNAIYTIDNVSVKQVDPNDRWSLGTGWSYGNGILSCVGDSGHTSATQSISFKSGKTYKVITDITITSGNFSIQLLGGGSDTGSVISSTGVHTEVITPSANRTSLAIRSNDGNGVGSVSSISIVEVQGDRPRLSYDITNGVVDSQPHLLLENSSTNLLTQSNGFDNWTSSNLTLTSGQSSAITALDEAWLFTATGTLANATLSVSSSGANTFSVFAKSGTQDGIFIRFSGSSSPRAFFNLSNGTLISETNTTSTNVEAFKDGWYRVSVTGTDTVTNAKIYVSDSTGNFVSSGNIYVQNAQLEQQSYATSYIPTAGTTITRAAETCNNSKPSVNSTEGVLYAETATLSNNTGAARILSLSDNTTNNSIRFEYQSTANQIRLRYRNGGASQNDFIHTLSNEEDFNKIAFKYKADDFSLYVNGTEVATDTSGSVVAANTFTTLKFLRADDSNTFYGKVKGLAVYNEALSESQLMQLTGVTASSIYSNFVTRTASFTVEALNEVKKVIDNL